MNKEFISYIFEHITTKWKGTHMIFPKPNGRNVVIDGNEIVKLIERAIEKSEE